MGEEEEREADVLPSKWSWYTLLFFILTLVLIAFILWQGTVISELRQAVVRKNKLLEKALAFI